MPFFRVELSSMSATEQSWERAREMRIKLKELDCMSLEYGDKSEHTIKQGESVLYCFDSKAGIFTKCAYVGSEARFTIEIDIVNTFNNKFVGTIKGELKIKKNWGDAGWWETTGEGTSDIPVTPNTLEKKLKDGTYNQINVYSSGHFDFNGDDVPSKLKKKYSNGSQTVVVRAYLGMCVNAPYFSVS